jgi:hypothetical protein
MTECEPIDRDAVFIAGGKRARDWKAIRLTLDADVASWNTVALEYFDARISTRYLGPIQAIRSNKALEGEGFSIVAIDCTLIEFLESTFQGKSYRFVRHSDAPIDAATEYNRSEQMFVDFLCNRNPFRAYFVPALASEFYASVRCGLLHEARTKGDWRIREKSITGAVICPVNKCVFRDDFHAGIEQVIEWYKTALPRSPQLQKAFVDRFDRLSA